MAPQFRGRRSASKKEFKRELRHQRSTTNDADDFGLSATDNAAADTPEPWSPSNYTAFKVLMSARLCGAIWNNIQDCDETFNYWEPTHQLLFGRGLQTWEYAPRFALRSYTYLMLHALPAYIYSTLLQSNRLLIFYFLRCVLALLCVFCEVYFYRGVCRQLGHHVGRLTLVFLGLSAGMFIACPAYLPSSFSMYMNMLAMGAWMRGGFPLAIVCTAMSTLLGWPFAAILGLPIAYDIVFRQHQGQVFLHWSLISLFSLAGPMTKIDSDFYGHLSFPPWNIVLYNVFSHTGANLYGTEPALFYFVNLFLNFNIALFAALAALPLSLMVVHVLKLPTRAQQTVPTWLLVSPMYLWMAVFFAQAHKEERFMFPVYPLLCLSAAVSVDLLQRLWNGWAARLGGCFSWFSSDRLATAALLLFAVLSVSRVVGQYRAFHAPLDTFMELNRLSSERLRAPERPLTVCIGREWHRFPSSFFLPELDWRLAFLESEFRGQLPQYYADRADATQFEATGFNDENREEPGRYVRLSECHFLVDVNVESDSHREPNYSAHSSNWTVLHSSPFMDVARSNRLLRAFYVPFLTERYCSYVDYNLLVSRRWEDTLFRSDDST